MKLHITRLAVLAAALLALPACSERSNPIAPEAPALKRRSGNATITGATSGPAQLLDAAGNVIATSTFTGTATVQSFALTDAGELVANVRVVGQAVFDVAGVTVTRTVNQLVQNVEVTQLSRRCPILELDIGAIHLDLLGLVIDLAPIHLDIVAESGPGNLLGNLLCALVGLLDGAGGLTAILEIIDQINAILAGF